MKKLNLCCGKDIRNDEGWINTDIYFQGEIQDNCLKMDMDNKWLFKNSEFDEIHAYHCLEHCSDKMHIINEIWRTGKNGCKVFIVVPHYLNPFFYANPQHKTIWHPDNFDVFSDPEWNYFTNVRFNVIKKKVEFYKYSNDYSNIRFELEVIKTEEVEEENKEFSEYINDLRNKSLSYISLANKMEEEKPKRGRKKQI